MATDFIGNIDTAKAALATARTNLKNAEATLATAKATELAARLTHGEDQDNDSRTALVTAANARVDAECLVEALRQAVIEAEATVGTAETAHAQRYSRGW